ncbi:helix-turn-helix domain-containing protein [Calidithermus terrae]|uniref:helix-turn-helix domain-containing protein n=1 Tax=Calidithermus terrae TaxID=1408545 RepID=UPI000E657F00|nr:hypothetical protein [Calidithermus terrae]
MKVTISWKLKEFLEREGITAYRLQTDLKERVGAQTIYVWVRNPPKRPDLGILAAILGQLSEYTGRRVGLGEVLEVSYE